MLELTPNELGCDEAGLGPLFGPVVAAAVLMPETYASDDKLVGRIKDSKRCSPNVREKLAVYIRENALAIGLGVATVDEIDSLNVHNARFLAMHRAIDEALKASVPGVAGIVVDGDRFKPHASLPHRCVVDGDNLFLNVAAASILAKTHRDHMVEDILVEHPDWDAKYKLSKNKGYGTKDHMDALSQFGPTPMHRMSFAPVSAAFKKHALFAS